MCDGDEAGGSHRTDRATVGWVPRSALTCGHAASTGRVLSADDPFHRGLQPRRGKHVRRATRGSAARGASVLPRTTIRTPTGVRCRPSRRRAHSTRRRPSSPRQPRCSSPDMTTTSNPGTAGQDRAGAQPRDGAQHRGVPPASSETARARMRRTRRRDTKPELALRSELHRLGLRYYVDRAVTTSRKRADVIFPRARVAVYIDGCFWHGCPTHGTLPKANREWWTSKLAANTRRDQHTNRELSEAGWVVLRFWEHDDPVAAARQVQAIVEDRRGRS